MDKTSATVIAFSESGVDKGSENSLESLLLDVRNCRACHEELSLGANPIVSANKQAKILIIGQAPGAKVHETGVPWNDPSGDRLREWMGLSRNEFYDETKLAIMPMGFCYPGKGKSGDLPPRKECAELWHEKILSLLPNIEFTLFVGNYAQSYYLRDEHKNLTERVKCWEKYFPEKMPLPHPSPRNRFWLKKYSWFEREVVGKLQQRVRELI
ncbi:MAG: uracil-DNA glycosylase family protein [Cellvibrionaceae bacterium]